MDNFGGKCKLARLNQGEIRYLNQLRTIKQISQSPKSSGGQRWFYRPVLINFSGTKNYVYQMLQRIENRKR